MKELMSELELSERYGFNVKTLRAHRLRGAGIPYVKHGARVYYAQRDVEDYLKVNRREPDQEG